MSSNSSGRFFEGLIVGGIFGVLFGMLTAPKSGAELRKQIVDESEDFYKQASGTLSEFKDKTNHAVTELQSQSETAIKKASDVMRTKKEQLTGRFQDLAGLGKAQAQDIESLS